MSTPPEEGNPLSRQRVSRACDLCRKKKVKCDGATPVCTNCKGVGLQCTFKDMTKKRGPPKGYIEAIENRLYKLENFLAGLAKGGDIQSKQLLSELNSPLETPSGEQIRARPVRRAPRSERNKVFFWQQDKAGKRKRESLVSDYNQRSEHSIGGEEDDDDEDDHEMNDDDKRSRQTSTDEGVGQLAMDENGQVRYLGKSSGYYLLQNSRTYQNGAFHFANYGNRPRYKRKLNKSDHTDPLELPPKDLSEHLIVLYFNHFYPFLPLFYKRQLFSSVDNTNQPLQPISPLLLNAIYAVASRISPDVRVRADPASPDTAGDIYFERAERLLDESYDLPSISTVQALLLLASHQHGRMKSARAWLYSGMAFRMAQDLGLHRNCDHWNIPPDECERRKRVFWCCYVVDRLASAMYGRASTFEERDCDVPFPSVDDDKPIYNEDATEPPVSLLDTFTNLIKICDILGHVLRNIYYVRSLQNTGMRQADSVLTTWNKKLHQWYHQLPNSLQIKKDNNNGHSMPHTAICQLHMIYHTTVILLHRPFIPGPNQSLIPSLLPCASICSSAADSVLFITNSMLAENKLRYVMNYAVYYIFTSGIIFIKSAANGPDNSKSLDAKVKVTKCMQALDEIEITWTTASKSCQILAELSGFRDINLHEGQQQSNINQWQQQQQQQFLQQQQQQQQQLRSPNNYLSASPQSSSASPQVPQQNEVMDHHSSRMNSSNLRFPVVRLGIKTEEVDDRSQDLYSSNSTQSMDFSAPNPFSVPNNGAVNNATAMDPFAAPGIIPTTNSSRQYDPLGTAFWGVPSSLDVNEWNNFMNSNQPTQQDPYSNSCLQDRQLFDTAQSSNTNSTSTLIGSDYGEKQHLIHTDQNVDVLSGVSLPLDNNPASKAASTPTLLSYLPPQMQQQRNDNNTTDNNILNQQQQQPNHNNNIHNSPISAKRMDGRPSGNTAVGGDLANAYYW